VIEEVEEMLAIRLQRMGAKKRPFYRVVVSDSRKNPTARVVDTLGHYDPTATPPVVSIDAEKAAAWVRKGARMSNTVETLLAKAASAGSASAAGSETAAESAPRVQ
jgi:small subunit ribosomal protein S16